MPFPNVKFIPWKKKKQNPKVEEPENWPEGWIKYDGNHGAWKWTNGRWVDLNTPPKK